VVLIVCVVLAVSIVVGGEPPVTKHEHADEMRDGKLWHCDTYGGSPVIAVFSVVV
jgi:hypothetical protein